MVKTIVVPLDGSTEAERAAPIAAALASRWGAEVVLLAVSSFPDEARRHLERVKVEDGFEARVDVVDSTDVVPAISGLVEQTPEPALCMTTHGRSRLAHAVLGSVAETLLREILVPFVLVGPHCPPDWPAGEHRLLACVDESETSNAIIEPAAAWAEALGLQLWLTEVFHPLDVESAQAPHRFLDTVVERLRPQYADVKACAAWSSSVPLEILDLAQTLSASMIAMGTHGRSGLARLGLGSVTIEVTRRAPCPVLTIRPPQLQAAEKDSK
jgi:nucleotide-binding universal stress UspA family protein